MTMPEFIAFLDSEMAKKGKPPEEREVVIESILKVVKSEEAIEAFVTEYKKKWKW